MILDIWEHAVALSNSTTHVVHQYPPDENRLTS